MASLELATFDDDGGAFEQRGQENGARFWYARDFMGLLGYDDFGAFEKSAINRAIRACSSLNIPLVDTIAPIERDIDGRTCRDYKLSRFGCYLVAINGDVRKPAVATAQAYFVTLAEAFRQYIQQGDHVERILIREDVTEREQSLTHAAADAGVVHYAFFQNEGYRGMYNMNLGRLRELRGIPSSRSPLDFMGREELAANLFRITQTEAKIRKEGIRGQRPLEATAHTVGRKVRQTMLELSGTAPEQLQPAQDIRTVKSGLKKAHRGFAKIDQPSPKAKSLPPTFTPDPDSD